MANRLELTPKDLEGYYDGDLTRLDQTWLQKQIDIAVREIFHLCPRLPERLAQRKVERELVIDVVAEAVLRVVRNPSGLRSETEGNYTYQLSNRVASGDIWFPPEDVEKVCGKRMTLPRAARLRVPLGIARC